MPVPVNFLIFQSVGSLVAPSTQCFVGLGTYLKRKWDYVKKFKKNLEKLEVQVGRLQAKERDIKDVIQQYVDRNQTQTQTNECSLWLSKVERRTPVLAELRTRHNNINKCFCGLCPYLSLIKLGKDIVKETVEIDTLIAEAIPLDQVMAPPPQTDSYARRHSPAPPQSYERSFAHPIDDLPSLNENVKHIEELLENDEVNLLCIYGLPGVGKTTVMKNLHNRVGKTNKFEIIIWVTMTEKTLEEIQRVLEERLGLQVEERSTNKGRAYQISEQLRSKRSYLLFLDQVPKDLAFKLEDVGIDRNQKHGKVVLGCDSSRANPFHETTDEEFRIKGLSESDARKLFKKIVKEDTLRNEEINGVATSLVRQCGGMPKLITMIASKLREKNDLALWKYTYNKLQKPRPERCDHLAEYYLFFQFAYETMEETEQHCLLYWEIFPVGHEIHRDYITECWRTEQLFTDCESFSQTRDSGHGILTDFVDTGILERGTKARHYKMFELFRPAAKRFAQQCNRGSHQPLVNPAEFGEWRVAERVSHICEKLSTLPEKPQCSVVRTLLLQENQSLVKIPDAFFTSMECLQLLDLHDTRISSLPSSISRLIKLKSLYLNDCSNLAELPSEIGQLQSLEIFDLSRTGIHLFLKEIEKLTNLKCLRISFEQDVSTNGYNHINSQPLTVKAPDNPISQLALLEELSICVNQSNKKWENIVDTIVEQVAGLEKLTALCFYFPQVKFLTSFTEISKSWNRKNEGENTLGSGFRSFNIIVGYHQTSSSIILDKSKCSAEKHLTFSGGEDMPAAILQVLQQACTLELIGHQNVTSLSDFEADMLKRLEMCKVEECRRMESIFDGNLKSGFEVQCLEKLCIVNIPTLTHIWKGSMKPDSLPKLTTLIVEGCPRLKNIFSRESEMVLKLPKLQHLKVDNCIEMVELIESGSPIESGALEKLTSINLRNLPNLVVICDNDVPLDWPSLKIIEIEGCSSLKDLPLTTENARRLDRIIMPHTLKDDLNWASDGVKQRFGSIFTCASPISSM